MPDIVGAAHPDSNQAEAETAIDFSVLPKIARSRSAQLEMLHEFNLENRSDIANLKAALKDGNPAAVARIAHRIKGASRMVGALELEGICMTIEKAAVQGDLNGVRAVRTLRWTRSSKASKRQSADSSAGNNDRSHAPRGNASSDQFRTEYLRRWIRYAECKIPLKVYTKLSIPT